jgi:hypothetical protein
VYVLLDFLHHNYKIVLGIIIQYEMGFPMACTISPKVGPIELCMMSQNGFMLISPEWAELAPKIFFVIGRI